MSGQVQQMLTHLATLWGVGPPRRCDTSRMHMVADMEANVMPKTAELSRVVRPVSGTRPEYLARSAPYRQESLRLIINLQ